MKPLHCVFALVFSSAGAVAAEPAWPPISRPRDADAQERVSLSLSTRAGLVKAPFLTSAFPQVSGFGTVLTPTFALQFSDIGWLRIRIPLALVRLDFPAGAQVGEEALGNLELGLERRFEIDAATRLALLAAVLVPSAQHGSKIALLDNRALAVASALNAGRDAPLLTPGVLGLQVATSVEHSHHPFAFRAALSLPLLLRISDASLPDETETHPLGILPMVDVRAAVWLTGGFGASLGAGLTTEPLRVQEPAKERDQNQRVQAVIEPGVFLRLGQHVALGLDASIPAGGALGGDAGSVNVAVRVGW